MALPVLESHTKNNAVGSASITLTKPAGVVSGDLLLLIVGNDSTSSTDEWDDDLAGYTLMFEVGTSTTDTHLAVFRRIADGTEAATIDVPSTSTRDNWGFFLRISGVDQTTPIDVLGTASGVADAASVTVAAVTTTVADCLGLVVCSYDGGDSTFTVSTNSWTKTDEEFAGTDASSGSGLFGQKDIASAGSSGSCLIEFSVSDGSVVNMFAIRPAAAAAELPSLVTAPYRAAA